MSRGQYFLCLSVFLFEKICVLFLDKPCYTVVFVCAEGKLFCLLAWVAEGEPQTANSCFRLLCSPSLLYFSALRIRVFQGLIGFSVHSKPAFSTELSESGCFWFWMLFYSWNYKMRLSPVMRLKRVIMLFAVFAVSEYCQYRKKRSDPVYFLRERYIKPCSSVRTWLFSFSRYKNFCLYCLRIVKLTAKPYRERIILFAYSLLVSAFVSLSAARLPSKHVRRESWYMRAHTHA